MTDRTYSYFSKIYILAFASMLGFCIFFRHGVEHSRYVLMAMSFIFLISNKKYFRELCRTDSFIALITFFAVALLSLVLNGSPLSRIDEVVNWIAIFIAGYIASVMTGNRNTRFISVIPVALLGAVVIYPVLTGAGLEHLNILSEDRLTLYFEEKANHLGLICGMFAFAASFCGVRSSGRTRVLYFLLAGMCAYLLFRTAARTSFLGTAVVFSGWTLSKTLKMRKQTLAAVLIAGACAFALLFYSPLKNNRIVSTATTGLENDLSFQQRFFTWNVAYTNFVQRPMIGRGFDTFRDQYAEEMKKYRSDEAYQKKYPNTIPTTNNAHNFFLHFLAETGLTGLCAMLLFWATVVRRGFQNANLISPAVAGMFLISLIAYQMNMSMYGLQISTILFAFAGLSSGQGTGDPSDQ